MAKIISGILIVLGILFVVLALQTGKDITPYRKDVDDLKTKQGGLKDQRYVYGQYSRVSPQGFIDEYEKFYQFIARQSVLLNIEARIQTEGEGDYKPLLAGIHQDKYGVKTIGVVCNLSGEKEALFFMIKECKKRFPIRIQEVILSGNTCRFSGTFLGI